MRSTCKQVSWLVPFYRGNWLPRQPGGPQPPFHGNICYFTGSVTTVTIRGLVCLLGLILSPVCQIVLQQGLQCPFWPPVTLAGTVPWGVASSILLSGNNLGKWRRRRKSSPVVHPTVPGVLFCLTLLREPFYQGQTQVDSHIYSTCGV